MTNTSQQDVKTTWKLTFLGTPDTQPTLSHIQSTMWNISLEHCCSFLDQYSKILCFSKLENKQIPAKKPFWLFTLDDETIWWRQKMQVLDSIKKLWTMHKSVSNFSFPSEFVRTRRTPPRRSSCCNIWKLNQHEVDSTRAIIYFSVARNWRCII